MAATISINTAQLLDLKDGIIGVINGIIVPILFAVAFLFFLYGVIKYFFLNSDSEADRTKGRNFVLWGVIGFAVILSVWGLVNLVLNTFMLSPGGAPPKYPLL